MIVWRVQDKKGRGPFDYNVQRWAIKLPPKQRREFNKVYRTPKAVARIDDGDFDFELTKKHKYAFLNKSDVKYFWNSQQLEILRKYGFYFVPIKAKKVWVGKSKKQVVYLEKVSSSPDVLVDSELDMNAESLIERVMNGESLDSVMEDVTEAPAGMKTRKMFKAKSPELYKFLSDRGDLHDVAVDYEDSKPSDISKFLKKHEVPAKFAKGL